jgi:hypothetical protein
MAVGLSQTVKAVRDLSLKVVVRKSAKGYMTDIIVNGDDSLSTGGLLDRGAIINYIQTALQYAQAYLDFLERASSEDAKMYNLNELRLRLEMALAHTIAYEIAEDA